LVEQIDTGTIGTPKFASTRSPTEKRAGPFHGA
jgi:hypothetical protein